LILLHTSPGGEPRANRHGAVLRDPRTRSRQTVHRCGSEGCSIGSRVPAPGLARWPRRKANSRSRNPLCCRLSGIPRRFACRRCDTRATPPWLLARSRVGLALSQVADVMRGATPGVSLGGRALRRGQAIRQNHRSESEVRMFHGWDASPIHGAPRWQRLRRATGYRLRSAYCAQLPETLTPR
jgi:hypothetical protein